MLSELRVLVKGLDAAINWAIKILTIVQDILCKTDEILFEKISFIFREINSPDFLPILFWLQVEEGFI